ncbi:S41 family peptidase [Sediminibacterium sp.]|uniref:S41 family peptidase n=1 Tax=Sediminibacterium sp. TaxID=1917865 RepID=UPI0025D05872|nr:S41 family peptidase [Sediminibacterium sp.]
MKPLLLFIFLFISNIVYSQDTDYKISKRNKKFIKEVSKIIKEKSLFSDSLNWNQISEELAVLPFGKNDSIDHKIIFDYFIKKLRNVGDKHSLFLTRASINSYTTKNSEPKQPESKYLGKGIGLLKIPKCMTFSNTKDREFANSIRYQIKKIDTENEIIGWVVDLRNNGGGNMWPMVAGLNALVQDGIVGYTVGTPNRKEEEWKTENGRINYSNELTDTYKIKKLNTKIAVLIDSMTASSGEMTAITFIGLPNVKLFGQPSAGFTTANSTFYLSDGTRLFLATKFVADRTHKLYPDKIIPDVIINTQSSFGNDETIEYSKKWLLQIDKK